HKILCNIVHPKGHGEPAIIRIDYEATAADGGIQQDAGDSIIYVENSSEAAAGRGRDGSRGKDSPYGISAIGRRSGNREGVVSCRQGRTCGELTLRGDRGTRPVVAIDVSRQGRGIIDFHDF